MAFVVDSFTDADGTALASHTGETGATWTKHASYTGTYSIQSNRAYAGSGTGAYYASGTPASAEYDVQATVVVVTLTDNNQSICARIATGANTLYMARHNRAAGGTNNAWELYKIVAGTATLLGSYSQALSGGGSYTLLLEIRDAAKKVYIDGVERISSGDNAITAAGLAGVRSSVPASSTTGMHLDDFSATDVAAAGQPMALRHTLDLTGARRMGRGL